jgi:hypothetical protein
MMTASAVSVRFSVTATVLMRFGAASGEGGGGVEERAPQALDHLETLAHVGS